MEPALQELIKRLPPPPGPTGMPVEWSKIETRLGVKYPTYFKNLLAVYGACYWFDLYSILFPANTIDLESYLRTVRKFLDHLVELGVRDEQGNLVKPALYPQQCGLFPFMGDTDGNYYFWLMEHSVPDSWPLMQWSEGTIWRLPHSTLAELFLDTIEEFQRMGAPERVEITR